MPMLAFFPWFTIAQDTAVGLFELLRYERSEKPFGQGRDEQEAVDNILSHYFPHTARPLTSATIVKLNGRGTFDVLRDEERSAMFALAELVSLSGLARREFFSQVGQYCNRDNFRVVIQAFRDPNAGPLITTRRRDGRSDQYLTNTAFRVDKPEHVPLSPIPISLDVPLLSALLAAQERDDWERFAESILSFNLANTDSSEMSEHVEAVLLVSAFERLLECAHGKDDELAARFLEYVRPSQERSRGDCARLASANFGARFPSSAAIREIWIRDFFRVRGDLAHGQIRHRYPAVWHVREHLLLGSYLFPILVRALLEKHNLYLMTKDDRFQLDLFERLACENLFEPIGNESEVPCWPWSKVFDQARAEQLHADIAAELERRGFLEND